MDSILLADWKVIRAGSSVLSISMDMDQVLDVSDYQDAIFWADVRDVLLAGNANVALNYQTSPVKEDLFFKTMVSASPTFTAPITTPTVTLAMAAAAAVPLSRYLRWNASQSGATGAWGITFRTLPHALGTLPYDLFKDVGWPNEWG